MSLLGNFKKSGCQIVNLHSPSSATRPVELISALVEFEDDLSPINFTAVEAYKNKPDDFLRRESTSLFEGHDVDIPDMTYLRS